MNGRAVNLWHLRATICIPCALAKATRGPALVDPRIKELVPLSCSEAYHSQPSGNSDGMNALPIACYMAHH